MAKVDSLMLDLEQACLGASGGNAVAAVQAALAAGAEINGVFPGGRIFALQKATLKGLVDVVEALLAAGASVDLTSAAACGGGRDAMWVPTMPLGGPGKVGVQHRTCLVLACQNEDVQCLEVLLAAGASCNGAHGADETPLTMTSSKGNLACLEALLRAGADVDRSGDKGETPLCSACSHGHLAVAEALMAAGADVNKPGSDEQPPLEQAIEAGEYAVVELLLSKCANITHRMVEAAEEEGSEFEAALERGSRSGL